MTLRASTAGAARMRAAVWKLRSIKEEVGGWARWQRGQKNWKETIGQKQRGDEETHKRVQRKRDRFN